MDNAKRENVGAIRRVRDLKEARGWKMILNNPYKILRFKKHDRK